MADTTVITKEWNFDSAKETSANLSVKLTPATNLANQYNDGKICSMVNQTSPVGYPETLTIQSADIKDIYSGTQILPGYRSTGKTGKSIVIQLKDMVMVKKDGLLDTVLPVSCHVVYRVPNELNFTAEDCETMLLRLFGMMSRSTTSGNCSIASTINRTLSGSLKPADVD